MDCIDPTFYFEGTAFISGVNLCRGFMGGLGTVYFLVCLRQSEDRRAVATFRSRTFSAPCGSEAACTHLRTAFT